MKDKKHVELDEIPSAEIKGLDKLSLDAEVALLKVAEATKNLAASMEVASRDMDDHATRLKAKTVEIIDKIVKTRNGK